MKYLITIFFALELLQYTQAQTGNYKEGDTLRVFTLGGLKLREQPNTMGKVLTTMPLGTKVRVLNTFQFDKKYVDLIESFKGNWIKVRVDSLEGYAFDGFLSALPIPQAPLIGDSTDPFPELNVSDYEIKNGQLIESLFARYIKTEFQTVDEPLEYYRGYNGEGYLSIKIQKLKGGFSQIHLSGWEAWSTELVIPGARLSEIKNLIILLLQRSDVAPKLLETAKTKLKTVSESAIEIQEILGFSMTTISLKQYPGESGKPIRWSIEMYCISS